MHCRRLAQRKRDFCMVEKHRKSRRLLHSGMARGDLETPWHLALCTIAVRDRIPFRFPSIQEYAASAAMSPWLRRAIDLYWEGYCTYNPPQGGLGPGPCACHMALMRAGEPTPPFAPQVLTRAWGLAYQRTVRFTKSPCGSWAGEGSRAPPQGPVQPLQRR